MNAKKKLELMREAFENIIWMAIRYAHGRHTYAPDMVREAIVEVKKIFPDFELKKDDIIEPPKEDELCLCYVSRKDWLDDLFKKEVKNVET